MRTKRPTKRELQAMAYHVHDLVMTKAEEIFRSKPITWESAVYRAIADLAEKP